MDIRELARIRREIQNGTYLTEEKLRATISQIFSEIRLDNDGEPLYTSEESASSLADTAYKRR